MLGRLGRIARLGRLGKFGRLGRLHPTQCLRKHWNKKRVLDAQFLVECLVPERRPVLERKVCGEGRCGVVWGGGPVGGWVRGLICTISLGKKTYAQENEYWIGAQSSYPKKKI